MPYELREAGVAARLAVDLLIYLVDQLEFFFHIPAVLARVPQLPIDADAFADNRHRRLEYVGQKARIEPGRLAGISREHDDQEPQHRGVVEHHGQYE